MFKVQGPMKNEFTEIIEFLNCEQFG